MQVRKKIIIKPAGPCRTMQDKPGPYKTTQYFRRPNKTKLTEISETNLMVSRPRPSRPTGWSRHRDRDRDSNFQSLETETFRDSDFLRLSRPRLIETKKFLSCRDRDSSRLANLVVVETETHRDWTKVVETETLTRLFQKIF